MSEPHWVILAREGPLIPAQAEIGETDALREGEGWAIHARTRKNQDRGNLITVVMDEPVLYGTREQVKSWNSAELLAAPVQVTRATPYWALRRQNEIPEGQAP
jgi:hypothetical protein